MTLLIAALVPVALILFFIYKKDTEKEPVKLLAKCFVWGIVSAIPAVFLAMILESEAAHESDFVNAFNLAFLGAAIPEEIVKFVILYWLIWKSSEFNQHYDGIVYAVFISLGFAAIENVLYVMEEGYGVALMRAFLSVPAHAFFGVSMGYFFSLAKFTPGFQRKKYLFYSLFIPILLHGLFDFFLFYASGENINEGFAVFLMLLFFAFVFFLWRLGFRKIKKHVAKDK